MRPNNVIDDAYSIEEISHRICGLSPGGQRPIVSVSGQLTKEVRFKPTFEGKQASN